MPLVSPDVETEFSALLQEDPSYSNPYLNKRLIKYIENKQSEVNKLKKEILMSRGIKRCLILLTLVTLFGGVGIIYFGYFYCPDTICALSSESYVIQPLKNADKHETGELSFDRVISKDFQFNIKSHDVIVFLHIQKTGGTTFGRHLVGAIQKKF